MTHQYAGVTSKTSKHKAKIFYFLYILIINKKIIIQRAKEEHIPCAFTTAFRSIWIEILYGILRFKQQEASNRYEP